MKRSIITALLTLACAGSMKADATPTAQVLLTPTVIIAAATTTAQTPSMTPVVIAAVSVTAQVNISSTVTTQAVSGAASALSTPVPIAVTVTPMPLYSQATPITGAPSAAGLWRSSQRQVVEIAADEKDGSLSPDQAAGYRAEIKSIRDTYGLSRNMDVSKLSLAERRLISQRLALAAEKVRHSTSKP